MATFQVYITNFVHVFDTSPNKPVCASINILCIMVEVHRDTNPANQKSIGVAFTINLHQIVHAPKFWHFTRCWARNRSWTCVTTQDSFYRSLDGPFHPSTLGSWPPLLRRIQPVFQELIHPLSTASISSIQLLLWRSHSSTAQLSVYLPVRLTTTACIY